MEIFHYRNIRLLYFLILSFVGIAFPSQILAQKVSTLKKLEQRLPNYSDKQQVDTILAIPYDIYVAELETSKKLFHVALKKSIKIKDNEKIAYSKRLIGVMHYYLGQYDSSSHYILSALELYDQEKNYKAAASLYCEYGHMIKRRDLKEAFRLMRRGLSILKKYNDDETLAPCMNNFGVLHEMSNDVDSALFYYNGSLKIVKNRKDSIGIPYSFVKIATALLIKKQFEKAKAYIDSAHFIRLSRNDLLGLTDDQAYYGDLYKAWKKYELAVWHFNLCIELSEENGYPYLKQYAFEELTACYEALGNTEMALKSFKSAMAIKDSILNEKNTKTVLELEERFKSAEKEKQISEQNKVIAEKKLENEQKSRQNTILFGSIILIVLLSVGAFIIFNQKAKTKRQLAIIEERDKGLKAIIETAENERRRIAKDLHDGIGQQLTGVKMAIQQISVSNEQNDKLNSITNIINETSKEVRSLSHRMMPKMLEEDGLLPALEDLFKKTLGLNNIPYEFNSIGLENRLNSNIELSVYRVAQEIINNILKHAAATNVMVDVIRKSDRFILLIEDNGKGFDTQNKSGLGLKNMETRLSTVGGKINIESELGKGSSFTINIPL